MTGDRTRRMRGARAALLWLVVTSGCLTASARQAAAQVYLGEQAQQSYASPQRFAFELRFGPYRPNIDSEFEGRGRAPYQEFFGNARRVMTQMELDYQVLRGFGSLGVGLGAGYFSATGKNPVAGAPGKISGDTSTLKLLPLALSAVYRMDWLYEHFRFPLIPYGKIGVDYVFWQIKNGNDEVARDPSGGTGRGGTMGWHAAAGLQLVLDFFEPSSARQFDLEVGVNHTHLFVEYGYWDISGFGRADKLRLGDTTWLAGLLLEF